MPRTACARSNMKSVTKPLRTRLHGFLRDWSLPRQARGGDPMSDAAQSIGSRTLRPRLEEADHVGTSVCPYCAVGCSVLIYAKDGRPIHVEGNPKSPINQGTLCPKGATTFGLLTSEERFASVLYRAPYSERWE